MTGTVTPTAAGGDARQRARLHSMWASVADGWETYADELDASRADVTAALLARAALRPGDRVLELACGPGGTGLAAVARSLGYASEFSFAAAFKRHHGIAPGRWRATARSA